MSGRPVTGDGSHGAQRLVSVSVMPDASTHGQQAVVVTYENSLVRPADS